MGNALNESFLLFFPLPYFLFFWFWAHFLGCGKLEKQVNVYAVDCIKGPKAISMVFGKKGKIENGILEFDIDMHNAVAKSSVKPA